MMIDVSPTVAYRINYCDNSPKQAEDAYEMPVGNDVDVYDTIEHCTYVTDFSNSDFIENYLQAKGVNFIKIPENEALSKKSIIERTVLPEEFKNDGEHNIALLNTEKFEKFYKDDDCYLPYNAQDSQFKGVLNYLKTGEDFEAPMVDIYETDKGLSVSFTDGRHRYATLKEIGFDYIPMCLDRKSYDCAKKYGLLS